MGKGDKKSKRGKIISGTYGVRRPKKGTKPNIVVEKPEKVKKTPAKVAVSEEKKPETKAPVVKKPAAKKAAAKKPAEKKTTAKKPAAKKTEVKKAAPKKTTTKAADK